MPFPHRLGARSAGWSAALGLAAALTACRHEALQAPPPAETRTADAQVDPKPLLAASHLVVLGSVTAIHDGRPRDGGMTFDVDVERVLRGTYGEPRLRFRSPGWTGYATYAKGERVLLFLSSAPAQNPPYNIAAIHGTSAVCRIHGDRVEGPWGRLPLEEYMRRAATTSR